MAFTTINADEDGWAMATFVALAPNTTIYFTDNEWTGTAFNGGESFHQWNTGASTIAAGTVVRFRAIDAPTLSASVGTLTRATVTGSTNYGLSQSEDSVYAYLGTSATAPTTFLAAISTTQFGSAAAGLLTNTGLSVGNGALQLSKATGGDFAEYTGTRNTLTTVAGYKPLVFDIANWNNPGDGSFATTAPNVAALVAAPIPEPSTYALLLAGMAAVGLRVRRNSRR
jgi:PEP-CTERM motif